MLTYPAIDPVAFHIPLGWLSSLTKLASYLPLSWPVYWYGLMYLFGFLLAWQLLAMRVRRSPRGFTQENLVDLLFYVALGVIIGGRLGYVIFYEPQMIWSDPIAILKTWNGGMSFHGGLLGVVVATLIYAKQIHKHLLAVTDLFLPVLPIGLGLGRIGNFINAEMWGQVTTVPWGMVFPNGGPLPRHPSQLYEFLLEGVLLFIILWCYSRKPKPMGAVSGLFLIGYGIFRCFIEFFRDLEPQNAGYVAFGWFTEGQMLSLPMILAGILMMLWAYRHHSQPRGNL